MASSYYSLCFSVLLSTQLFMFISASHSLANNEVDIPKSESPLALSNTQKVNLNLYYESLCPYCRNFVANELVKVFTTDLGNIVNLRLVPWGNTYLSGPKLPVCQHGEAECYLNEVEACAIKAWPEPEQHFPLIQCLEYEDTQDPVRAWEQCASILGLSKEPIHSCLVSGQGLQLSLEYGEETGRLNPPLQGVPWVTVDGKPLADNYPNFITYVCNQYQGRIKPSACRSLSNVSKTDEKETSAAGPVCYAKTPQTKMEPST